MSSDELEEWFFRLSFVCVMVEITNDYTIAMEIGSGSFAKVYEAYAKHDSGKYAVKHINKRSIERTNRRMRGVISEVEIMRALDHPMLVRLHRVYDCEESISLVLDYVPHKSLSDKIITNAPYSEALCAKFARDLLETLVYVHSRGVVHLDLKPDNILMTSNDPTDLSFKIADFGLAAQTSNSFVSMMCGSPGYVAPEVLKNQNYGTKADLFSVGIILHVM